MTAIRLSLSDARPRRRQRTRSRTLRRLTGDSHVLLALGLVVTTLAIAAIGGIGVASDLTRLVAISAEFLAAQSIVALAAPYLRPTSHQRLLLNVARFALAILYIAVMTALLKTGEFRPTGALFIPIVALAAAQGARQA